MIVRWNLTRKKEKIKNCDILILSVAKSGRTWLRVLLNKYISLAFDVPFGLEDLQAHNKSIPSILFTHEMWNHIDKASISQKLFGKYVVPDSYLLTKKVVLLYRDPRDILVSLYFHKTKRSRKKIQMDLIDFMTHKGFGIKRIIQVLNVWRQRLEMHPACFWISYENLKCDTVNKLIELIHFIGFDKIREDLAKQAVEFAEFDNMKEMEAAGEFKNKILRPVNPSDPDSFKVREGRVGGYKRYFSEERLSQLDSAVSGLAAFYGYRE